MSVDRSVARQGVIDALPLFVPAIPFGLVIGLAITSTGMNPLVGWSGSWLIFAGAAQLTLITLLGGGVAMAAAVGTALVVNARHLMYSAALAPTFQSQPRWFRWLGPYLLVDQLFALITVRPPDEEPATFRTYYLAAGATFWLLWQPVVALGLFIGPVVPEEWNLEFAIPLLFIGLLVLGIDKWPEMVAALVGALVTFLAADFPNRTGLLVGALVGMIAGFVSERLRRE
jgi:predicted branched-subunit amino acid permease